jgi:hypothetical protein
MLATCGSALTTDYSSTKSRSSGRFDVATALQQGRPSPWIEDRDHNIWAEAIGNPARLVRVQDFEIRAELPAPQMPAAAAPAADPQDGIWLGLVNGNLAHYRSRQLDIIPVTHGQPLRVRQVLVSSDGSALGATPAG